MGFWKSAFNVAKAVGDEVGKQSNELQDKRYRYENFSDEELLKILSSDGYLGNSQKDKMVAFSVLKSRGYDADEIKVKM